MPRHSFLLPFTFLLVMLTACQVQPISLRPTARTTRLGEDFTLAWGESITLSDAGLIVTLESVADSRCPTARECAEAGTVEAVLHVGQDAARAKALVLSAQTDGTGQVIPHAPIVDAAQRYAGYIYTLLSVTPYPNAAAAPAENAYRVTLRVTGSGS